MGIWEAMEKLSELVDDSDPDVSVSRPPNIVSCGSSRLWSTASGLPFRNTCANINDPDVTGCFRYRCPGRDFDLISSLFIFPRRPSPRSNTCCRPPSPSGETANPNGCKQPASSTTWENFYSFLDPRVNGTSLEILSSSDASFRIRSFIRTRSRTTQTRKTPFIRPSTVFTNHTVDWPTFC